MGVLEADEVVAAVVGGADHEAIAGPGEGADGELEGGARDGGRVGVDEADSAVAAGEKIFGSGEQAFAKALALDPQYVTAYLGQGHLQMERGDLDKAEASFRHGLSIDAENLGARLALTQVAKTDGS